MGSVLDYLGSTQWDNLSPAFKSSLASLGITTGTYLDNGYTGKNGTDIYFGLGGNDAIHGKGGNDVLFGNAGEDNIKGEDGNDFLDGGIGADMLIDGIDKIKDFNKALGGDTLDFRDIISSYDAGDAITDYVQARNANGGSTILSFDADGAGTGAAFDIAKLQNVSNLDIQTLFDNGQILV
jgi:Ca2+-binding RTX toxin-like protein